MHLRQSVVQLALLASAIPAQAASVWGFTDATVSVQTKGAGVGSGLKLEYELCSGPIGAGMYANCVSVPVGSLTTSLLPAPCLSGAWILSACR